jgi:NCS1 family nucleobase:cation symporter-1
LHRDRAPAIRYRSRVNALVEDVSASIVENGVPAAQQTMTVEKVFWLHFSVNLAPATWVLGALLIVIGLDFKTGLIAIVVGNLLGSALVAANALLGPRTGFTQIEISRFSFGRLGARMPAALNWFNSVGWEAVGSVPSAIALVALFHWYGLGLPFWAGLVMIVGVQLVLSICGHHVVQLAAKYLSFVLLVLFGATGIVAIAKGGALVTAHAAIHPAILVLGIAMTTGEVLSFAPYTSDYTRYLPRTTNSRTVFALVFAGLALSTAALELCGLLTATRLTDLSTNGIIAGIGALAGAFAPLAFFALAISTIPSNSINDNTAGYCMISTGIRIPRHIAACISTATGFTIALLGAAKFADLFSGYLVLSLYWIAPWTGIMLVDWWFFRGDATRVRRWGAGATIFLVTVPVTFALFTATPIYTGPIAKLLDGADIGFVAGFIVASLAYAAVVRTAPAIAHLPAGQPAE